METKCNCGNIAPVYHSDENHYEPGCWDCYYQQYDAEFNYDPFENEEDMPKATAIEPFTDDDLPF